MSDIDSVHVHALFFENANLFFADTFRRPGVGGYWGVGTYRSLTGCTQHDLLSVGDSTRIARDFNDTGLNASTFYPFFNFPYI